MQTRINSKRLLISICRRKLFLPQEMDKKYIIIWVNNFLLPHNTRLCFSKSEINQLLFRTKTLAAILNFMFKLFQYILPITQKIDFFDTSLTAGNFLKVDFTTPV